jgi:5-methylcytosine-specific restriction endonuclease McrA
MATKRDSYDENEHSILYAETGGCCPLCTLPILFKKKGSKKTSKGYEVAHIYPLNPTKSQAEALVGYPVPADINALENVIALCPTCHTKYDKDFKLDELIRLRKIKDEYLSEARAKLTASQHTIQEEVYEILDAITTFDHDGTVLSHTSFDISTVDNKLKTGMSPLQKHEIKINAISYYVRIRDHIRRLELKDQASRSLTV